LIAIAFRSCSEDFHLFFLEKSSGSLRFLGRLACTALLRSIHRFFMLVRPKECQGDDKYVYMLIILIDRFFYIFFSTVIIIIISGVLCSCLEEYVATDCWDEVYKALEVASTGLFWI